MSGTQTCDRDMQKRTLIRRGPGLQHNIYNNISSTWRHPQGGSSAASYATKGEGHPRGNDTPSAPKVQLKILFAALTSATVIIFLILACRFVRAPSWVVTRKLSSHDLSGSGSHRQTICEDSGDETPEDADPKPPQAPLEPPKPKKAKVEAAGGLRGAQSVVEEESTSGSDDERPSTSAGRKRKRKAGAPPSGTATPQGPESPARSEGELEAASALLSLQHSLAVASEPSMVAGEPSPASAPSDAPIQVPVTSVGASQTLGPAPMQVLFKPVTVLLPFAIAFVPSDPSAPTSAVTVGAEGTQASAPSTSSAAPSDGEQPSTSSAAEAGADSPEERLHPYYRTPTVDPQYLSIPRFRPEDVTDPELVFTQAYSPLRKMRHLLGRATLGPAQLNELAELATRSLSSIFYLERAPTRNERPSLAARNLGRRFLLLDGVIATLEVLKVPVRGQWWDQITSVIPDDTLEDEAAYIPRLSYEATRFNKKLIHKLHRALRILKTGRRISAKETIAIKRMLFCSYYSPNNFRSPRWEPWRQDDRDFQGTP
ncbi:hypothetical protein ACSSS7_005701 [Eimeria intestinalis]